jgi:signal peptidase I
MTPSSEPPGSRRRHWLREVLTVLVFVAAVSVARASVADHYYVPTGSMIPTVEVGDRVVVSKLAYGLRVPFTDATVLSFDGPAAGDVVVLRSPEDGITLLKRVVAVPGDLVSVHEGRLWRNGRLVPVARVGVGDGAQLWEGLGQRAHPLRLTRGGGMDMAPTQLGRDEYLVMGDNRGESHDGRAFGLVHRRAIMGKALSVWMRQGDLCWRSL